MPWHAIAFNVTLLGCLIYAWARGGTAERAASTICLLAAVATVMVYTRWTGRFHQVEAWVLDVDLVTLVAFVVIAVRSDRYWPLCVAGLQAASIIIHFLKALVGQISPTAYAIGMGFWGWAIIVVIMIGTWRYQRRTKLRHSLT